MLNKNTLIKTAKAAFQRNNVVLEAVSGKNVPEAWQQILADYEDNLPWFAIGMALESSGAMPEYPKRDRAVQFLLPTILSYPFFDIALPVTNDNGSTRVGKILAKAGNPFGSYAALDVIGSQPYAKSVFTVTAHNVADKILISPCHSDNSAALVPAEMKHTSFSPSAIKKHSICLYQDGKYIGNNFEDNDAVFTPKQGPFELSYGRDGVEITIPTAFQGKTLTVQFELDIEQMEINEMPAIIFDSQIQDYHARTTWGVNEFTVQAAKAWGDHSPQIPTELCVRAGAQIAKDAASLLVPLINIKAAETPAIELPASQSAGHTQRAMRMLEEIKIVIANERKEGRYPIAIYAGKELSGLFEFVPDDWFVPSNPLNDLNIMPVIGRLSNNVPVRDSSQVEGLDGDLLLVTAGRDDIDMPFVVSPAIVDYTKMQSAPLVRGKLTAVTAIQDINRDSNARITRFNAKVS